MIHRRVLAFIVTLAALGLGASTAAEPAATPWQPGDLPGAWVPSSALFLLHSAKPDALLDLLLDPAVSGRIPLEKGPAAGLAGIGRYLETQLGCDWKTVLRRSMRQGLTFAAGPGGATLLIAQADEEAFLHKLNEAFAQAARWADPQKVSQTAHAGAACWTVDGGKEYHAIVDGCLLLSNRLPALQQALDLRAGTVSPSGSLAGLPEFRQAKAMAQAEATAVLFAAPSLVNALPVFKRKPNAAPHPLAVLLRGTNPQVTTPQSSGWLALDLGVKGQTLSARPAGQQLTGQPASFATPPAGDGALPNLAVPRQVAALSVWRDLRGYYAAKDALFPERTSALILFENLMGIYFSGRDLTEDVLGALDPHLRLVVAGQEYDSHTGTPATKLPAFAAVFRMREPDQFEPVIEEAWQKAIGLVNITRGQKAQPGLVMDKRDHGGVRYSCASFSAVQEPDKTNLDARFNFQPALARAGQFLILSSTEQLTNDLIDALRNPSPPVAASNGLIEIDGARLAAMLLANREGIVRGNMLKKGQERAVAEKEFGTMTTLARLLGQATLQTGEVASKPFVDLKLDFGGSAHPNP